jgi:hypothetical protein
MRLAHCKKGPERCDICREWGRERILLLDTCPSDAGLQQRRVIELTRGGETVFCEFDVVGVFDSEEEARAYAAAHLLDDVEL